MNNFEEELHRLNVLAFILLLFQILILTQSLICLVKTHGF